MQMSLILLNDAPHFSLNIYHLSSVYLVFYAPALSTQQIQAVKPAKGHKGYAVLLNVCYWTNV